MDAKYCHIFQEEGDTNIIMHSFNEHPHFWPGYVIGMVSIIHKCRHQLDIGGRKIPRCMCGVGKEL